MKLVSFWLQGLLSVILLFGTISLIMEGGRYIFWLELAWFVVLLGLITAAFWGYARGWGREVFLAVYLLYLLHLVLLWVAKDEFFITLALVALVGFFLSLPAKTTPKKNKEEPPSMVFDAPKKAEAAEVKKTFIPGKYLASHNSNVYHLPRCEWAKKIAKSRQVWFASKDDAWDKGYKGHECVE